MPLTGIAAATGLAPSKLRFYLISFIRLGLVIQDPLSGRYSLGPHAIKLGLAALEQFDVITASQKELHNIVDTLGYSAFLGVWGNHGPTIVFRLDGRHRTVLEIRIGSVLPLVNSAIGRVFLSYMPRSSVAEVLKMELANSSDPRWSNRDIDRLIAETRAAGLAVARGTLLSGFTAIAAPIMDHAGLPAAAMSIIGPIGSFDDGLSAEPASLLRCATTRLSEQIGGQSLPDQRKRHSQ
jgi:DNA-binding IclR family transcriptional regulator